MNYLKWIDLNVSEDGYGKCSEITLMMERKFPELHRVRGHYYCLIWGERTHWWLVTQNGDIVDPTKEQFPSKGTGKYVEWPEGDQEPTGKCPNCSGYCFNGQTVCSEKCHIEYSAYLNESNCS